MKGDFESQFTEARTRLSITLEQAASATKIRVNYLMAIEAGDYNSSLPDIYWRGFTRIYAKFLHLDEEEIMKQCPIKTPEVVDKTAHKGLFTSVMDNEREIEEESHGGVNDSVPLAQRTKWLKEMVQKIKSNKKISIIAFSTIAILLMLVILIKSFSGHRDSTKRLAKEAEKVLVDVKESTLSLVATNRVKVVVRSKNTGEKIFVGNLTPGEVKKISYSEPIQVFYENGEHLMIKQADGEQIYPQPGRGGIEIK